MNKSGIRVALLSVASATIAVACDYTCRMTVELRYYLAVAVSALHASDIGFVAHPIIRSSCCRGDGAAGKTITAAVAMANNPVRKLVMFVVPNQAPHYCAPVPVRMGGLTEVLYVRCVTSNQVSGYDGGVRERPILSCGDPCSAWPMIIRGMVKKTKKMDIITSWS